MGYQHVLNPLLADPTFTCHRHTVSITMNTVFITDNWTAVQRAMIMCCNVLIAMPKLPSLHLFEGQKISKLVNNSVNTL